MVMRVVIGGLSGPASNHRIAIQAMPAHGHPEFLKRTLIVVAAAVIPAAI
jgi:hypothetical protein